MRKTPTAIWNVISQQLELRFPLGRPTSATFEVFRAFGSDDATPEFSGAATVDAPNTTTSSAAGRSQADPQRIALTSTADLVELREYLIGGAGLSERVQIMELGAGFVRVRLPLQNDYASGATFQSTTLFASIPDVFAADRGKLSDLSDTFPDYRVKWAVTYAGAVNVVYSFFDLVRSAVTHDVSIADINDRAPGLMDDLPLEYKPEQGRPLVNAAELYVRAHLVANGVDPNSIRDPEAFDELVIRAALLVLAEGGWHPKVFSAGEYVALTGENYRRYWETHFGVVIKPRLDLQVGAAQRAGEVPRRADRFAVK